jgi:hypothetical protein
VCKGARAGIEGTRSSKRALATVELVAGEGRRVGREGRGGLVAENTLTGREERTCSVVGRRGVAMLLLIVVGSVTCRRGTAPLVRVVHGGYICSSKREAR